MKQPEANPESIQARMYRELKHKKFDELKNQITQHAEFKNGKYLQQRLQAAILGMIQQEKEGTLLDDVDEI